MGDQADSESWRSISSLNSNYKLVSSMPVSRLRSSMPHIVGVELFISVPGRNILSPLSLTRDVSLPHLENQPHRLSSASTSQNLIENSYLLTLLRRFGLSHGFVALAESLYEDGTARLAINGKASAPFAVTRRLRQGCQLNRFLFVLSFEPMLR